jgi:hypothetical protein
MNTKIRTYAEMSRLQTFEERFEYLKISGAVGRDTFGFDRYLNQIFYKSKEWKSIRNQVILRDNGCDLGLDGYDIYGKILIHHMNPITKEDVLGRSDLLLNPDYLICVTHDTHNAIHYGNKETLASLPMERHANDTCPWR